MKNKKLLIHYMAMTVFYSLELHYTGYNKTPTSEEAIKNTGIPTKYHKKVLKALTKFRSGDFT